MSDDLSAIYKWMWIGAIFYASTFLLGLDALFDFLFLPLKLLIGAASASATALAPFVPLIVVGATLLSVGFVAYLLATGLNHRRKYPLSTFDRDAKFTRSRRTQSISECVNCGLRDCAGVVHEYGKMTIVAGNVMEYRVEGDVPECMGCHDAFDSIEYALRRERDDPDVPEVPDTIPIRVCQDCGTHNGHELDECSACGSGYLLDHAGGAEP